MTREEMWIKEIKRLSPIDVFNNGTMEMYHGGTYSKKDSFCGMCWHVLKNETPGERLIDWDLFEEDIQDIIDALDHYGSDKKHPDYIFLTKKLTSARCKRLAKIDESKNYSHNEIVCLSFEVNGNRLEIPKDIFIYNYADIKAILKNFGGKYSKNGFEFTYPAEQVLERIRNQETMNLKKTFQFFGTPKKLCDLMCDKAFDPYQNKALKILEPSAGQGAIIDSVLEWFDKNAIHATIDSITAIEFMKENYMFIVEKYMEKSKLINIMRKDFLEYDRYINYFDVVIANPPFSKNQDIKHFEKMYEVCAPGGMIVSIMSNGFLYNSGKIYDNFRKRLGLSNDAQTRYAAKSGCTAVGLSADGHDEELYIQAFENGEFKESGTNVHTVLLCLKKNSISGFDSKPQINTNKEINQQFKLF